MGGAGGAETTRRVIRNIVALVRDRAIAVGAARSGQNRAFQISDGPVVNAPRPLGAAVTGEGAVDHRQRAVVENAASDAAVTGEGAVDHRQRAVVLNAAHSAVVTGEGAVAHRQRAVVIN